MQSSQRRKAIRAAFKAAVVQALAGKVDEEHIFGSSADADEIKRFANIYFTEGERTQQHAEVKGEAEIVVRLNTNSPAPVADDQLDDWAGLVDDVIEVDAGISDQCYYCFNNAFRYGDSPSGGFSALELVYHIQYED